MASQFAAITSLKEDLYDEGSVDPVYQAKTRVLNQALQEIGMGKYQVSSIIGRVICPCWLNSAAFAVGIICGRWFWVVLVRDILCKLV